MTPFTFFLLALAVHRATHLVTDDRFPPVAKARDWVVDRKPEGSLAYLVGCFWCVSVWTSAAAVLLLYATSASGWTDGVPVPVATWLALSTAATAFETLVELMDAKIIGGGG